MVAGCSGTGACARSGMARARGPNWSECSRKWLASLAVAPAASCSRSPALKAVMTQKFGSSPKPERPRNPFSQFAGSSRVLLACLKASRRQCLAGLLSFRGWWLVTAISGVVRVQVGAQFRKFAHHLPDPAIDAVRIAALLRCHVSHSPMWFFCLSIYSAFAGS